MASPLVNVGRFFFIALIVTQCFLLASYPAHYKDDSEWYGVVVSYAPSILLWIYVLLLDKFADKLHWCWLYLAWGSYVCGLVISIIFVFAVAGDGISEGKTLGPIFLKGSLCITPLLLLLLLNTASSREEHQDVCSKLCFQLAVELFDGVEMLDIVLDEKEHDYGIPEGFGIVMIIIACISFLLSPWPMLENNPDQGRPPRRKYVVIRIVVEMVVINSAFLIIRLVIVFGYKKDESIFIAKNIIAIILSLLQIREVRRPTNDNYI